MRDLTTVEAARIDGSENEDKLLLEILRQPSESSKLDETRVNASGESGAYMPRREVEMCTKVSEIHQYREARINSLPGVVPKKRPDGGVRGEDKRLLDRNEGAHIRDVGGHNLKNFSRKFQDVPRRYLPEGDHPQAAG